MKLKEKQSRQISYYFEELLARVRVLRDEYGFTAPGDEEFHLLFTNPDDYDVENDHAANIFLDTLRGIAIGLGLDSTADLYQMYKAGELESCSTLQLSQLVSAARKAIAYLAHDTEPMAREVIGELQHALANFQDDPVQTPDPQKEKT